MPVARIFTTHPERTDALSRQLQSQGYTVEVAAPGAAVSRPAELEIDFEIWPEDTAVDRAAELAEELHADVAVEPGLGLSVGQVAPQPAPPQVSPLSTPQVPVELMQPQAQSAESVEEKGLPQPAIQSAVPDAATEPALLPQRTQGGAHDVAPEPQPAYRLPEQHEPPVPLPVSAMGDQDSHRPRAGLAEELWSAAGTMFKEAAERARVYLAERNVRREQRLLELTERKAVAQENANELQAAQQAASARLAELVRMGGTEPLPASQGPVEEVDIEHVPASAFAQVWSRLNGWWRMLLGSRLLGRRYSPQVQAILTGVAAIMALFVLGIAIASLRPRPALSNSLDSNYKGVTVKTGGATVTGTPAPAKSPDTRPSPVVVRTAPNTGKQSPAHRAGDNNAAPQSDSGDVSVRHLKAQAQSQASKPAAKNTPQTGMKRISDLDN